MRKLALVLLAACSSSNQHHQVIVNDAPPDQAPDVPPSVVELDVFGGTPSLVAYRDGAGAWQTPAAGSSGTYSLTVGVDYEVVVACHDAMGSFAEQLAATAADGARQYVFCNRGNAAPPSTVAITGHMVQAGDVVYGDTASSTTAPWNFSLNVVPGMHDLIASSTDHRMLIRRNQSVSAAGAVAAIDTTADGTAMTPLTLAITGQQNGEMLFTGLDLFLQNDFASWFDSTTTVYAPPASLLAAGDFQYLFVEGYTATQSRFAETAFTGTETSFTLPPPVTGIVFGPGKASWSSLPAYDDVSLQLDQTRGQLDVAQTVRATKGWIDATHATSLGFDANPPGFDASWNVDTTSSYSRVFQVTRTEGQVTYGSMVNETSTAQRTAKRAWFSTVARLRESMRSQHTMPRR